MMNNLEMRFNEKTQNSIETGYFVFTMMPSLRCKLNCPHCYLTLDQRRNSPIMTVDELEVACKKVREYYDSKPEIDVKNLVFYWYGGEPTDMGIDYMLDAFNRIEKIFPEEDNYLVTHDILTSLIKISPEWFEIFKKWGRGKFQTSFDGLMRGKNYVKLWEKRVREAIDYGLEVVTISVVNNDLIQNTPEEILEYLCNLGIKEASFLPFMLNEQNKGDKYEKYAPPMQYYSDFMIRLSKEWQRIMEEGKEAPFIGQMSYIKSRLQLPPAANIPGQTMFLLPDGDFVLPDYRDGYMEYMKPFGNIFDSSFDEVLNSKSRKEYLRKQWLRNRNSDCQSCENKNHCIMEFWKPNRAGDECFGANQYVNWLKANNKIIELLKDEVTIAS